MKAIQAILAALGLKKAEAVVEAVETVATSLEQVAAAVHVHAANGHTVAFLSAPDMPYELFKEYADKLRAVFSKDSAANGVLMPRVVILPPGVSLEVVKHKAAEVEAAVLSSLSGGAA
jgi:phosphoserine phosphatase